MTQDAATVDLLLRPDVVPVGPCWTSVSVRTGWPSDEEYVAHFDSLAGAVRAAHDDTAQAYEDAWADDEPDRFTVGREIAFCWLGACALCACPLEDPDRGRTVHYASQDEVLSGMHDDEEWHVVDGRGFCSDCVGRLPVDEDDEPYLPDSDRRRSPGPGQVTLL